MRDAVYYAIGDIHGEFELMLKLHREIERFHAEFHADVPKALVYLGDYVDRGPDSAGVVAALLAMQRADPDGVICLKGNHEVMMVDALRKAKRHDWWRSHGGAETLDSYLSYDGDKPPESHLDWLDTLPTWHHVPDRKLLFVHASIDPDNFPETDERTRLWGRTEHFFRSETWDNSALEGYRVVHGHTPTDDLQPEISADGRRINLDTGAVYGGALTAVALAPDLPPRFISV